MSFDSTASAMYFIWNHRCWSIWSSILCNSRDQFLRNQQRSRCSHVPDRHWCCWYRWHGLEDDELCFDAWCVRLLYSIWIPDKSDGVRSRRLQGMMTFCCALCPLSMIWYVTLNLATVDCHDSIQTTDYLKIGTPFQITLWLTSTWVLSTSSAWYVNVGITVVILGLKKVVVRMVSWRGPLTKIQMRTIMNLYRLSTTLLQRNKKASIRSFGRWLGFKRGRLASSTILTFLCLCKAVQWVLICGSNLSWLK